jgi:hypothetical protein
MYNFPGAQMISETRSQRSRRSAAALLLFSLFIWQFLVVPWSRASAEPLNIVWRSKATSSDSLALDFANLYGALDRLYSLGIRFSTKQVKPSGRSLQQVLLDEHQYVGSFLAPEVPRLVCGLNAKTCSRSSQTGEPKWGASNDEPLIIPAIDFQSLWTPEYYTAKKGDTMEAIVLRDRRGCANLDSQCKEILRSLNPEKGDVVENPSGRIVVPTLNYFAELKLEGTNLPVVSDKAGDSLKELDTLRMSSDESTKRRAEAVFSAVKPVVPNIVAVSGVSSNAATTAPASSSPSDAATPAYKAALVRRQAIFKSIGVHGWDLRRDGPPLFVNVALIDSRIDEQHCDFYPGQIRRSITPLGSANKTEDNEMRGECDLVLIPKPSVTVHGTHVAGIMSAKIESRIGPGMYPFTTVYSYELDLGDAKTFLQSIAALHPQVLRDQVKVLNVSSRYVKTLNTASDPFEEMLGGPGPISQQMLVVAAAGNDGLAIGTDQDCPPRPACYNNKYRNVISVIAIDDNQLAPAPAVFNSKESSNWGEHFDIAAPGLKVPSTAPLNQIAELDGTSQAAPIVSGAAANLYALRPAASPGEIKNRLIWTSDLLPSLSKKAFGGRINVAAALDNLDRDVFLLDDDRVVTGAVLQKDRYILRVRDKDTAQSRLIAFSKIRRMVKRLDGSWDILWISSDEKDAPLLRKQVTLQGMKFKDEDTATLLETDAIAMKADGSDLDIKLSSKVADYICSMR